MNRLDPNTVELTTDDEVAAKNFFEDQLDRGFNIPESVRKTKNLWPLLGQDFYHWLAN